MMPDDDGVRYTVKELLSTMNDKLDRIEQSLQNKADKPLVDLLAQKIESVATRIPSELIKEHAQLLMQNELDKVHNEWIDQRIAELAEKIGKCRNQLDVNEKTLDGLVDTQTKQENEMDQAATTKRWILGLLLTNLGSIAYSTYSIIHGFAK